MTQQELLFIKKKYATIAAAQSASTTTAGSIVFDEKHGVICVNGVSYGGAIQDVNYDPATNKLTIVHAADPTNPQVLDFSDVASASSMMAVFSQIKNAIGITDAVQNVQDHYTSTTYLQGAQSVVMATQILDTEVKKVQGAVQGLQQVAFSGQGVDLGVTPIEYGGVTVQGPDGTAAKNAQDAFGGLLQGIVDNEKVTEEAFEAVQNAVGLDEHLNYVQHTTTGTYTQGAQSVDQAITALDDAIKNVVDGGKTYTIVQGATTEGALKSYVLMEQIGQQPATQSGIKIDIPKDFLVKSASVITVVEYPEGSGQYYDATDTSHTNPLPVSAAGKYIDFVINAKESVQPTDEHLYLPVNELVDVYTAQQNATEIQLAIDANNVISATIVAQGVQSHHIAQNAVQSFHIQGGAVTTEKIADDAVNSDKIADGAVQSNHLANLAVQTANIQGGAVTSDKLANSSVQTAALQDGSVTAAKLAEDLISVPQTTPEIKVNDDTQDYAGTTIATIGGQDIKAKVGLYWSEWDSTEPSGN